MDVNKLAKLHEIGYEISRTCGNCAFSKFRVGSQFGRCRIWGYSHAKHSEEESDLSVNVAGHCPSHSLDYVDPTWMEFLKK